jgi:hypothetical protein
MQITSAGKNEMKAREFGYYMHDGPAAFSIELAGAMAAEGAKKLEQDWGSASAVIGKKELVVDLSFVTEIDPVGRQLLLHWRRNGATVVAKTPESRALVESIIGRPLPFARTPYTCQPYRSGSFFRDVFAIIGLLVLLIPSSAVAQRLPLVQPTLVQPMLIRSTMIQSAPNQSLAFARYIAWLNAHDSFTESSPVALAIVASLPGLDKQGSLLAIRDTGESERSQYGILALQGAPIVFERVIAPYLLAERLAENLPRSSVIITPRNYRFCYAGTVENGDRAVYVFRITPKENRAGLIRGELWIEPVTGAPVLVTGHLVKTRSTSIRAIHIVREIAIMDGFPRARRTHMVIETRPVGRAELTIIELSVRLLDQHARPVGRRS